jgi:predicted MFS family arabinose efflux permease
LDGTWRPHPVDNELVLDIGNKDSKGNEDSRKIAFRFVLTVGIVNLFADMTYEGARANTGPFLGALGASAAAVGFIAGFGELLGYALRSVSGYLADKSHRYWAVIFLGYFINMMAVPALALAGSWRAAGALIVAERTGRAVRKPAVEAMISHAGKSIGHGWVFGLNEALDQTGATVGPLITALILYMHGTYAQAFATLLIPAVLCLIALMFARAAYALPHELEQRLPQLPQAKGFSKAYWTYLAAGAMMACGFADFSLIAFHFHKTAVVSQDMVPVFYAITMAVGAVAALVIGRMLDKVGVRAPLIAFALAAFSAPFVFFGGPTAALAGMLLWGIGMGAQDSSLKAVLARIVPSERRSTAFGVFDTAFGVAWFAGSAAMGLLYERSIVGVVLFSVVLQLAALPVFYAAKSFERFR